MSGFAKRAKNPCIVVLQRQTQGGSTPALRASARHDNLLVGYSNSSKDLIAEFTRSTESGLPKTLCCFSLFSAYSVVKAFHRGGAEAERPLPAAWIFRPVMMM